MADLATTAAPKKSKLAPLLTLLGALVASAVGAGSAVVGLAKLGMIGGAAATKPAAEPPHPVDYVEIDNSFTSNLVDTGRYLQLKIAVSTTGGAPVVAALTQHRLAIVSAVLGVLGDLAETDVAPGPAKDRLRAKIRAAINGVLTRKAATAGVDEVFIISMVVQ